MVYTFGLHQKIKAFYIYLLIRYIQNALIFYLFGMLFSLLWVYTLECARREYRFIHLITLELCHI